MKKNKIIHLIPYEGIGGVERAAGTMRSVIRKDILFSVETIFPAFSEKRKIDLWNPLYYIRTVIKLMIISPEILIVSLWRSCFVGVIYKILRPSKKLILFLHSTKDVHFVDRILTRIAYFLAFRVWADSYETLLNRIPDIPEIKGRVISFVLEKTENPVKQQTLKPVFIFWGRLHQQKNLKRAIRLFSEVYKKYADARYLIIGPDAGDMTYLKEYVLSMKLTEAIVFLGEMNINEIKNEAKKASFYLQTSDTEGMAMSVLEAMQLGLVPIVTPVGEIRHYAKDGDNALVVNNDSRTVSDIIKMIEDDDGYQAIRKRAINTWIDKMIYKDSVLDACCEILCQEKK